MKRPEIRVAIRAALHGQSRGLLLPEIRERAKYTGDSAVFRQEVAAMLRIGVLKKHAGETERTSRYSLDPERVAEAPRPGKAARKAKAAKKAWRARGGARPVAAVRSPAVASDLDFSISARGRFSVRQGDALIELDAEGFTALRTFIDRTVPVWDPEADPASD